jgi:hypothetical protein
VPDSYGYIESVHVEDSTGAAVDVIPVGQGWQAIVSFVVTKQTPHCIIAMSINTTNNITVRTTWSAAQDLEPGRYQARISDNAIHLSSRIYGLTFGLSSFKRTFEYIENCISINMSEDGASFDQSRILTISGGEMIINPMDIEIRKI